MIDAMQRNCISNGPSETRHEALLEARSLVQLATENFRHSAS